MRPGLSQLQVSHYNPTTNRCYVEISAYPAHKSNDTDQMDHIMDRDDRKLFDGQTGELLASAYHDKEFRLSFVKNGPVGTTVQDYDAALKNIDAQMADDRKQ